MTGYEEQRKEIWTKPVKQGFRWKGHDLPYQDFLVEQKQRDHHQRHSIDVNWTHANIDEQELERIRKMGQYQEFTTDLP